MRTMEENMDPSLVWLGELLYAHIIDATSKRIASRNARHVRHKLFASHGTRCCATEATRPSSDQALKRPASRLTLHLH